ncbi:Aminotriazole resistance protein [Cyberlindnera fabianii]|uniref:Aminotriazole resistance protein n=1 Tax=Cyberlindnera fabianii TaxID=36022 RepID=A0A1V2KZU1_CYBFA|nr:Aminotriazole resistance protein [Cyberlindnera fabianii]
MNALTRLHNRLRNIVPMDKRKKWPIFFLVLLGTSADNINLTGSITTFFSVYEHFHDSSTTVSWTLSAYGLTLGSFILLAGKVTDIVGAHNVYLFSLSLMALFALITALIENSIIALIVIRALQGMAAAFLVPSAFAVAGSYFQGKQFMYALIALMLTLTGTFGLGLVLGGAFSVTNIGYKGFYYFTFAQSAICAVLLYLFMIPVERTEEHKQMKIKYLDYYGSSMFVIGALLIILGFTESGDSWKKPSAYVPIPVGVVILIAALWFELYYIERFKSRVDAKLAQDLERDETTGKLKEGDETETTVPQERLDWRYQLQVLFPREALQIPNFLQFIIATPFLFMSFFTLMVLEVQYWLYIEQDSQVIAGVKMLTISVGFFIGCAITREEIVYKMVGLKWVLLGSQLAAIPLQVWISRHHYNVSKSYWKYEFVPLLLHGWMSSTYFSLYINAVLRNTPVHLQGVVSGLLQTVGQVAICLGNAVLASIVGELVVANTPELKHKYNERFDHTKGKVICLSVGMKPNSHN